MLALFLGAMIVGLGLVIYRLTVHPLSSFQGPVFAAASGLFIFYYDVILDGKLPLKLEKLHDQYGANTPAEDPRSRISISCHLHHH